VVDLESGAGNDCFVARHETGETGKVIGVDFTEVTRNKARISAKNWVSIMSNFVWAISKSV
jgi:ubiquinone/menaquinone biosynthesis C-methylase UbiE